MKVTTFLVAGLSFGFITARPTLSSQASESSFSPSEPSSSRQTTQTEQGHGGKQPTVGHARHKHVVGKTPSLGNSTPNSWANQSSLGLKPKDSTPGGSSSASPEHRGKNILANRDVLEKTVRLLARSSDDPERKESYFSRMKSSLSSFWGKPGGTRAGQTSAGGGNRMPQVSEHVPLPLGERPPTRSQIRFREELAKTWKPSSVYKKPLHSDPTDSPDFIHSRRKDEGGWGIVLDREGRSVGRYNPYTRGGSSNRPDRPPRPQSVKQEREPATFNPPIRPSLFVPVWPTTTVNRRRSRWGQSVPLGFSPQRTTQPFTQGSTQGSTEASTSTSRRPPSGQEKAKGRLNLGRPDNHE